MFGIGFFELLIIVIVILVFFGPQKLPELIKQFTKFFVQVKKVSGDSKEIIDKMIWQAEEEIEKEEKEKKSSEPTTDKLQ